MSRAAQPHAQHVGPVRGVAAAGAVANLFEAHGGPLEAPQRRQQCGARWRHELAARPLPFDDRGVGARHEGDRGRGGQRQDAVLAARLAPSHGQRRDEHLLDAKQTQPCDSARHVHQRINGADFVQLDAFQRLAVHLRFNFAQDAEDLDDALFVGLDQRRAVDDVEHLTQRAMTRRLDHVDVELGRGEPGAVYTVRLDAKRALRQRQLRHLRLQRLEGQAGVQQAPRIMSPEAPEKQSK